MKKVFLQLCFGGPLETFFLNFQIVNLSSRSKFLYGSKSKSFEAKGLIFGNQTLNLFLKGLYDETSQRSEFYGTSGLPPPIGLISKYLS